MQTEFRKKKRTTTCFQTKTLCKSPKPEGRMEKRGRNKSERIQRKKKKRVAKKRRGKFLRLPSLSISSIQNIFFPTLILSSPFTHHKKTSTSQLDNKTTNIPERNTLKIVIALLLLKNHNPHIDFSLLLSSFKSQLSKKNSPSRFLLSHTHSYSLPKIQFQRFSEKKMKKKEKKNSPFSSINSLILDICCFSIAVKMI